MSHFPRIEKLSTNEKLRLMEELWIDLRTLNSDFESPSWHQDILEAREKAVKEGAEKVMDWEVSKKRIRSRV